MRIGPAIIDCVSMMQDAQDETAGALVVFTGMVRTGSNGKTATGLFYEAYPEMAENLLSVILDDAISSFGLTGASCRHRTGELFPGDIAVIVLTSSAHRKAAYDANQYIIDRVKFELPIWKNEFYSDGSHEWRHNFH